ncbi:LPXTG cell wall anchor domain-containing protein [Clostridium chauvoei]|uniref:Gram-positive cocci surface proteins LPxTG domain-containing protein n=2 Tax=Clostridium chauvoei TaxID=46867 RepID=S6EX82_9CLOT|nr:LPXTG cell wall anchor domain-containing protein [Clostridium chauvoei]ATD54233.1 hypothetical protein BTM20_02875 [Clostridium chauvoei]ATD58087.1 hypothetical protein BTM21_10205 [Clostridium chauvoei]MBX7279839.1 LPXTG cell wall anchor domain-containing protein [Clostridium chauvoei]MBX7282243.1 LPXTG cell wall anchor domain-containing protein [Clostridium chauvoei]MBX7284729.1 LPXTG cell wall anchor domain-containing protein [Clostridium chauvoei]
MKRFLRFIILTLILTLNITCISTTKAFAIKIPSKITLIGDTEGIRIKGEDFLKIDNLMPGDKHIGIVDIESNHEEHFELYMRIEQPDKKDEYHLLDKLNLKLTIGNKEIYDGLVSDGTHLKNNIFIGVFKNGDREKIKAELSLDGKSVGNEYADKKSHLKWVFTATNINSSGEVDSSNGGNSLSGKLPSTGQEGIYKILGLALLAIASGILLFKNKKS